MELIQMKRTRSIWAGLTAIALLVSCNKEIGGNETLLPLEEEKTEEGMTFSAYLNPGTRSHFKDETSPVVEWDDGESVMISAFRISGMTEDMFDTGDDAITTSYLNSLLVTGIGFAKVDESDRSHAMIVTNRTVDNWLFSPNPDPAERYLFFAYYPVSKARSLKAQSSGEMWYDFEIPAEQDGRSYWKYQLFYDYKMSGEDFAKYYTRDGIESGATEVTFNDFQPVNSLLRFRLKLPDASTYPLEIHKIEITASGTDRAIVGNCTSNIVENWLNPAAEGASMTLTLKLEEPVTVSSTLPDDYLYASLISQKDNGFSGTFDLTFTGYDKNNVAVIRATKTSPEGGLEAGKRYIFDLTMEEIADAYEYHLSDMNEEITLSYLGGDAYFGYLSSYRTSGSVTENVPFSLEYFWDNGDGSGESWHTEAPAWLTPDSSIDYDWTNYNYSYSGYSSQNIGFKVAPQVNSAEDTHHDALVANGTYETAKDLSTINVSGSPLITGQTTANCYVVDRPGKYKIPLVYGNGIMNGAVNERAFRAKAGIEATEFRPDDGDTYFLGRFKDHLDQNITTPYIAVQQADKSLSAILVWQDAPGLVEVDATISGSGENAYLTFEVPAGTITQGNALVAVLAKDDPEYSWGYIAWSWHIWVTDENLKAVKEGSYGNKFAPVNIGWCEGKTETFATRSCQVRIVQAISGDTRTATITQESETVTTGGNNPFFQWGRKDPLQASNGFENETIAKTYYSTDYAPYGTFGTTSLGYAIQRPNTFYSGYNNNWASTNYHNLWSSTVNGPNDYSEDLETEDTAYQVANAKTKTIYDPSPVGFRVPALDAWYGFESAASSWEEVNGVHGRSFASSGLFFPAAGLHGRYSFDYVGTRGLYHSSVPGTEGKCYIFEFDATEVKTPGAPTTSYYVNYNNRNGAYSIRPVVEI